MSADEFIENHSIQQWEDEDGVEMVSFTMQTLKVEFEKVKTDYHRKQVESITDDEIEIKYKDNVLMPKNNYQGTYNLHMPNNTHKRDGAKWFKQTLLNKIEK